MVEPADKVRGLVRPGGGEPRVERLLNSMRLADTAVLTPLVSDAAFGQAPAYGSCLDKGSLNRYEP